MVRGTMWITVTSLELRSLWGFFELSWNGLLISRQARSQPGFVAMKNTGFGRLHYTLTAWSSEDALKSFARTGAHKAAMAKSRKLATEIRTLTYTADALPDWATARARLQKEARVHSFREPTLPA